MSQMTRIKRDRDPEISRQVEAHLPLVRRIAWHVHGRVAGAARIEVEDLVQTGMIALVEAAQNYEDRGYAFATYAGMRIRGAMIDQLRRDATICRSAMARRKELAARSARLTQQLGRPPMAAEMAADMGISVGDYQALLASAEQVREQSIDEVYSDHSMWFADVAERADDALERSELQDRLAAAIMRLPEREAQILQMYFVDERNLDEIGAILGVGAARVCQIKKVALDKVRMMLSDGAFDD
jgi:RNA polymerase sigma factor for flagellar operon FliA